MKMFIRYFNKVKLLFVLSHVDYIETIVVIYCETLQPVPDPLYKDPYGHDTQLLPFQ
jgi:hypothetical protein